jgi:hypothetical protein
MFKTVVRILGATSLAIIGIALVLFAGSIVFYYLWNSLAPIHLYTSIFHFGK